MEIEGIDQNQLLSEELEHYIEEHYPHGGDQYHLILEYSPDTGLDYIAVQCAGIDHNGHCAHQDMHVDIMFRQSVLYARTAFQEVKEQAARRENPFLQYI